MRFLRVERQSGKAAACLGFHGSKAPREFQVGVAQRTFGIDAELAGLVDDREE